MMIKVSIIDDSSFDKKIKIFVVYKYLVCAEEQNVSISSVDRCGYLANPELHDCSSFGVFNLAIDKLYFFALSLSDYALSS